MLGSLLANVVLTISYGIGLAVADFRRRRSGRSWRRTGRILVTGTFYNENWYLAHILPLASSGVEEVLVVTDVASRPLDRVRYACPPRWLCRILTRAGAKLLWMFIAGVRHRPDLYMGYHIFPGALSALWVARLMGRPVCYQMTGGPIELEGGGWQAENPVLRCLGRPSPRIERLALRLAAAFDLVVVRGHRAADFLQRRGVERVEIIPGSVGVGAFQPNRNPRWDLVFVGRLTQIKQPHQFIEIVAEVARVRAEVKALVVGGGPELESVRQLAMSLKVRENVEFSGETQNVPELLGSSRVFVLTSRSEGLSISMLEAMAAGLPVVVPDVGDLGDVVVNGQTGYLVEPDDVDQYVLRVLELLSDENSRAQMGAEARAKVTDLASRERVAACWSASLSSLLDASELPRRAEAMESSPSELGRFNR
ncbi:MAG: glycosyltransferase family 4 protein [Phycisphaerales bacterium]|nr:MAG: glycosyltransferase family 4 protein [Phycisphaerales bacterium]